MKPLIIPDSIIKSFDYGAEKSDAAIWRIKWRGKFLTLQSGKHAWKTKGRARSAFIQHCNYGTGPYFLGEANGLDRNQCYDKKLIKQYVDEMIKVLEESKQIEYVQI